MYQINKNNVITLTRGDYLKFPVSLVTGVFPMQKRVVLEGDDTVMFALMEPQQKFENALIKKEFTSEDVDALGNLQIKIQPEDTIGLAPGTYYYQVKMIYTQDSDEDVHIDTIIQKTKFIIVD